MIECAGESRDMLLLSALLARGVRHKAYFCMNEEAIHSVGHVLIDNLFLGDQLAL